MRRHDGLTGGKDMNRVVIRWPKQQDLVFRLRGKEVLCSDPDLQKFFKRVGVVHFNGCRYFPVDGRKFLEAIHDWYFLSLIGIKYHIESFRKLSEGGDVKMGGMSRPEFKSPTGPTKPVGPQPGGGYPKPGGPQPGGPKPGGPQKP